MAARPATDAATTRPARARPEHSVFDLIDNRALAHWLRDGDVLVMVGGGGVAKYLWPGKGGRQWRRPGYRDGEAASVPGRRARFDLSLTDEQAARTSVVSMRVHVKSPSAVTIGLNERVTSRRVRRVVSLRAGWQVVSLAIPAGRAVVANNALRLRFRDHGAAVAWIQLGAAAGVGAAPAVFDSADHSLVLTRDLAAEFYVRVPEQATLVAQINDGCELAVEAQSQTAKVTGIVRAGQVRVSLAAVAGQIARLTLRVRRCDVLRISRARLVVPGTAARVTRGRAPKNIILWVMDTLRADRVRAIDPGARAETPVMESLARTGAVFRSFYVEGNESQTSHSSLFTSLYPAIHKVITAGPVENYRLSPRFAAIAPLLQDAGFQTVGVTANGNVHSWTGYRRGFEVFNNIMRDGTGRRNHGYVSGDIVYRRVISKLGRIDVKRPFFLFVGTVDTHKPWVAHEPWTKRYDPGTYRGRFKTRADNQSLAIIPGTHVCTARLSARDKARILALYDTNISFQDALLGKLLHKLEEWGIRKDTMIIVVADHGEELWEYPRKCGHGSSLRESLVRVPLLVHYPPLIPRRVVEVGVDGVDVLPTILDALGRPPLDAAQGESLLPVSHGVGTHYPRPAYASMNEMSHTMRLGRYKMWVGMAGVPALYDVTRDPDERLDLVSKHPFAARWLRDALLTFLAHRSRWHKRTWGVSSNMTDAGARALEPSRD